MLVKQFLKIGVMGAGDYYTTTQGERGGGGKAIKWKCRIRDGT